MEIILLLLGAAIYFIPTWIGGSKRNGMAIFWLNLLAGWTFIGWVAAFVWAVSKDSPVPAVSGPATSSLVERTQQLKAMRDNGTLTQAEFMEQVAKLG